MKKSITVMMVVIGMILSSCAPTPPTSPAGAEAIQYLKGTWIEETSDKGAGEEKGQTYEITDYSVVTYEETTYSSEGQLQLIVTLPDVKEPITIRMKCTDTGTWSVRPNGTYESVSLTCTIVPADEATAELCGPGKAMEFVIKDIQEAVLKDPYLEASLLDKEDNSFTFSTVSGDDRIITQCRRVTTKGVVVAVKGSSSKEVKK
jgi:hypothetical protein